MILLDSIVPLIKGDFMFPFPIFFSEQEYGHFVLKLNLIYFIGNHNLR